MTDPTNAERQRRHRAHKTGDHSLCTPGRPECSDPYMPSLRARGRRMWDQLLSESDPIEVVVLVEEICRLADRLDRLDAIVNGRDRAWLRLEVDDVGEVTVIVDKVLTEARQQQTTFKALLSELRAMRSAGVKPMTKPVPAPGAGGGDVPAGVTDLTARIAERSAQATG